MRLVKMVISLALIGMLAYCWSSVLGSTIHNSSDYDKYCDRGQLSYEEGLYKDAYENFTKALELKPSEKLTDRSRL